LYAVTNHFGSLNFGHYTAVCKNFETGKWWDYNDSSVSELDNDHEAVSNAAYVLYYKRKDFYPNNDIDYSQIRIAPSDQSNGDLTIIPSTVDTN
jgi:Ubiquitin carboxyl-terminal hydrolase